MKQTDWDKINFAMLNEIPSEPIKIIADDKNEDEIFNFFNIKQYDPYFTRKGQYWDLLNKLEQKI